MEDLTLTQNKILSYIIKYLSIERMPPTLEDMAVNFHYKSINAVKSHLRLIEKKGYIRIYPGKSRGIQVLKSITDAISEPVSSHNQIPIIGNIAAGVPILANQTGVETLNVPAGFFDPGEYFALHVTGDSMKNIGINIGDIAIIRHQSSVENGEIAAVIIEDEATLKRFFRYTDHVSLKSENFDFPDIVIPESDHCRIKIAGKLSGLLTKKITI